MENMPNPPAFDPSRMIGGAENARANMGDARHEEQLREADRAKRRTGKDGKRAFRGRVIRWFKWRAGSGSGDGSG